MASRYCVIMCGGKGSRFWPFSRNDKPKQFLDFFGSGSSLLQLTADRASRIVGRDKILLVTNSAYIPLIREQLPWIPEENILAEPARRNTAPCILWAVRHIAARDPQASMVVLPSDHLVLKETAFLEALSEGFDFVERESALLTLGIKPTGPNTGYGYIQRGLPAQGWPGVDRVKLFTEKPDLEMAREFVASGEFFWNAGIFLWSVATISEAFRTSAPDLWETFATAGGEGDPFLDPEAERIAIARIYPECRSISIDYAVMETARNVFVRGADIGWSDLGTWDSLYQVSPKNADGNVTQNCRVLQEDCSGTIFATEADKVVLASGLKDFIVADTPQGLLVAPRGREQEIGEAVKKIGALFGDRFV